MTQRREKWGEFAVSSIKLTIEPSKPDVVTLSRTSGRRLYDEIQVNGSMPGILKSDACSPNRHLMDPSKMVSFAPSTKLNQTAPSGRRRNGRAHVRKLFQVRSSKKC
ncbi:unnamed protein product [Gongylonema pulchrum]|uniref:CS domain-containing protein n=1 Tax=Gongylonema pulchrum TaxID=637853 RepID=A0A183EGR2_9BILA|nr:unnamed protein product [Gongylonema pulchrum]